MKSTGIVRKLDNLGRVVIPMEIKRTMEIEEKDGLEIFVDRAGLSRQGVESTRNSLIQYGLIEYKKVKSNQAGSYRMISLLEDKRSDLPVDNFSECKNLATLLGTPVAHFYTKLDVDKTINNSACEATDVDNSEIDSLCPKCKG